MFMFLNLLCKTLPHPQDTATYRDLMTHPSWNRAPLRRCHRHKI